MPPCCNSQRDQRRAQQEQHQPASGECDPENGGSGSSSWNEQEALHRSHYHAGEGVPVMEPLPPHDVVTRESFIRSFASSRGPPQIAIIVVLLAFGFGSTVGVVPAVMTDRYARLHHGYTDARDCGVYSHNKPTACLAGSAEAQTAVAWSQLLSNGVTFVTSSLVGSLSDEYGRKGVLVLGVLLATLSPLFLLLIQLDSNMSPFWYYAVDVVNGLVNWIAVALSSLSDVMPPRWRAPSFGMLLAAFSLGFALAPQLALYLGHVLVTKVALGMVLSGLAVTVFCLPETLPPESAVMAVEARERHTRHHSSWKDNIVWKLYRPFWELSILNRSSLFRLLSALAFFSGLVQSGDRTLILYYIEERLGFNDKDIAIMFLIMGLLGIFVQGVVLKLLNDLLGERHVVMMAFAIGTCHNILYGLAENKATIFVAVSLSSFVGMAFPTISAIKANNVDESEQGRIQGALYSLSALASALGPISMKFVYHFTKDGALLGPGTMFIAASSLYATAVYCAYSLPDDVNSHKPKAAAFVEDCLGPSPTERSEDDPLLP